jgi:hypothetical protein
MPNTMPLVSHLTPYSLRSQFSFISACVSARALKFLPISTHVTAPFVPFPGGIALLIAKGAFVMRKRVFRSTIATVCATLLAAPAGLAQQSSGQSTGQSASQSGGQSGGGQPAATPAGGISGGTAPIETTLFAYRALQSNADEIA